MRTHARSSDAATSDDRTSSLPAPGRRTLTGSVVRRSGGNLPGGVRDSMETAFGQDFGGVRVHESGEPAAIGAVAFARGEDLHFAPGHYDPSSTGGLELIGHELAHVVQQRNGHAQVQAKGSLDAGSSLEVEADALGAAAARGQAVAVRGAAAGVQCLGEDEAKAARPGLELAIKEAPLDDSDRAAIRERLPQILDEASSASAASRAVETAIYDAFATRLIARSGLVEEDREAANVEKKRLETTWWSWSGIRTSLVSYVDQLKRARVRPQGHSAFLEEGDQTWQGHGGPRSRYSGAPLLPGKMVLTIIACGDAQNPAGHSYLAFEWFCPYEHRRVQHIYHLAPEHDRWDPREEWHQKAKIMWMGELDDQRPGFSKSWEVPYSQGDVARLAAQSMVGTHDIEYAILGYGGMSCATFASQIAGHAGINASTWLGTVVQIPLHEVKGGHKLGSEAEMWKPRKQWQALLPRMSALESDPVAKGWVALARRQLERGEDPGVAEAELPVCEDLVAFREQARETRPQLAESADDAIRHLAGTVEDAWTAAQARKALDGLRERFAAPA